MSEDHDLLSRATGALRDAAEPTSDALSSGRARLLEAHRRGARASRARTLRWVLPLAAMLAAASALAATPERIAQLTVAVSSLFAREAAMPKRKGARRPVEALASAHEQDAHQSDGERLPVVAATPAPLPAAERREPPVAASEVVARAGQLSPPSRRSRHLLPQVVDDYQSGQSEAIVASTAGDLVRVDPVAVDMRPAGADPGPVPMIKSEVSRYREAHRLHFFARDFTSALRGWDDYLLTYPAGTFALEARYNRAICLIRIGRKSEAQQALLPFARGEMGHGYRQTEAKKLLEALE